jgi:hypothetical protein
MGDAEADRGNPDHDERHDHYAPATHRPLP